MQFWISRHFNSRSSSERCSRNRLNAVTKLSRMNAGRKNSSLTPKSQQSPQLQMRTVFVALILKFQSLILAERTSNFDLKELKLTKFAWQTFWKYLLVLNWIPRWKMFRWTRNSFFLLALNTNPPKQEADRLSESKQSEILLKYYFGLSREAMNCTFCHSSCQRSAMLWTILSLAAIRCCRCWSN